MNVIYDDALIGTCVFDDVAMFPLRKKERELGSSVDKEGFVFVGTFIYNFADPVLLNKASQF